VSDGVDFVPPACNEVCAVPTFNSGHSLPSNGMVVKQRGKNVVCLKNTECRLPLFYPLFYPAGTSR